LLSRNQLAKAGQIAKYLFDFKSSLKINNQLYNCLLIKKKEVQKKFNVKIDYLEVKNEKNLTVSNIKKKNRLFFAYYINKVRLIDNF
jgi:pantoate--beta-alanine ligase